MPETGPVTPFTSRDWLLAWLRTATIGTLALAGLFVAYEIAERLWLRRLCTVDTLFKLHIYRGVTASVLLGTWTFYNIWQLRRRYDAAFVEAFGRLERAMGERTQALAKAQAQLRNQEKLAALGVLSAGIAHDIANPLASMSSELEMLEGERDLGRAHASAAVLRDHVSRISRTLREMTDFARRRGEDTTDVRTALAVEDALRLVRHDPRARRVRFIVDVPAGLPALRIVEDHLVMVLVNLLINSLDAMPEGGRITIRAWSHGDQVRIAVSDTGTGMTEEARRRATEPLFTTKPGHGTGLGLSISADVLRAAGGGLDIESAPGVGTTVHLTCPTVPAQRRAAHA